jgi:hypothetical protein
MRLNLGHVRAISCHEKAKIACHACSHVIGPFPARLLLSDVSKDFCGDTTDVITFYLLLGWRLAFVRPSEQPMKHSRGGDGSSLVHAIVSLLSIYREGRAIMAGTIEYLYWMVDVGIMVLFWLVEDSELDVKVGESESQNLARRFWLC